LLTITAVFGLTVKWSSINQFIDRFMVVINYSDSYLINFNIVLTYKLINLKQKYQPVLENAQDAGFPTF
jgi:hypothetical protein